MTHRSSALAALCAVAFVSTLRAQSPALTAKVRAYRTAHDAEIVRELSTFIAIPNLASDAPNIRRNVEHLLGMMTARGIRARVLESPNGGTPAVSGSFCRRVRRSRRLLCALRPPARGHDGGHTAVAAYAARQTLDAGESDRAARRVRQVKAVATLRRSASDDKA
jgi:hypothetical protein